MVRRAILMLVLLLLNASCWAQPRIRASGDGYELWFYKDFKKSGQKLFRERQEYATDSGMIGQIARDVWGLVATETNYTYLACNLVIDNDRVLYVPKGTGNFILTLLTPDGPVALEDQGVFIFYRNASGIHSMTTVGDAPRGLFINPDNVELNSRGEPKVVVRFQEGINFDQIVRWAASDKVQTIARR